MARSDKVVAWSETADKSRTIRSAKKVSETKSKIFDMINRRTGGPRLTDLKEELKLENNQVATQELNRFKASMGSEINEEDERAIGPRVNRVFNSITQTLLRTVQGQVSQKTPIESFFD